MYLREQRVFAESTHNQVLYKNDQAAFPQAA
jgi:hypothetical protein